MCEVGVVPSRDTGKRGITEQQNNGITFNCRSFNFAETARAIDIHNPQGSSATVTCCRGMKRAAKSGNNKNVCKSVAKHHQFWLSYQLSCEPHLLYSLPLKSPKGVHLHPS